MGPAESRARERRVPNAEDICTESGLQGRLTCQRWFVSCAKCTALMQGVSRGLSVWSGGALDLHNYSVNLNCSQMMRSAREEASLLMGWCAPEERGVLWNTHWGVRVSCTGANGVVECEVTWVHPAPTSWVRRAWS